MIEIVANVLLCAAALGCYAFVLAYHVLADWRASALGRNVMAFMAVAAVMLSLAVVRAFVQPSDHVLNVARLVAYGIVGAIVWHRVWLLFRYSHEGRDEEHDDDEQKTR